jgi:hypothetical protein
MEEKYPVEFLFPQGNGEFQLRDGRCVLPFLVKRNKFVDVWISLKHLMAAWRNHAGEVTARVCLPNSVNKRGGKKDIAEPVDVEDENTLGFVVRIAYCVLRISLHHGFLL